MTDLRDAARRTLRAGTVRVTHEVTNAEGIVRLQTGVADIARRLTLLRMERDLIAEWLVSWLRAQNTRAARDLDPAGQAHADRMWTMHVGAAWAFFDGERWTGSLPLDERSAGRRSRADPLWIVEQLTAAREAGRDHFHFVDREVAYDGRAETEPLGRLRLVTWTTTERGRPRVLLWRRGPRPRIWQTLRLTDYGLAVELQAPVVEPPSQGRLTLRDVRQLWWWLRPRRRP